MLGGLGPTVVPRSCLSILEQQAQDQLVQGRQQDPAQPWETEQRLAFLWQGPRKKQSGYHVKVKR